MAEFEPYGTSHQIVGLALAVGAGLLVYRGRAIRGLPEADRFSRVFALAIVLVTVPLQARSVLAAEGGTAASLPLQLCDVASAVAAYALWTRRPWATAVTFFWGLTLTPQALITPDLSRDFPDPGFLLFWSMHLLVVWAAVYLVWGLGLTPTWRSYRTAVGVTLAWAVAVGIFNVWFDTNYGYLSHKPGAASVLDWFGPWPLYVVAMVAIVVAGWAMVTWPFTARLRH